MAHNGRLNPPLSVIEAWPAPNTVDPAHRHGLVPVCIVLFVASAITLSARFYARGVILKKIGVDDWLMLAAMVPTLGLTIVLCLAETKYKFGYHAWDLLGNIFVQQRKLCFALEVFYMFSTSMIKLSLLSFYLRLSAGPTLAKPFRRLVWLTIVIVIAFCGAYLLCLVLACRPLRSFWLAFDYAWAQENEYYCDSEGITLLTATAVSVLLDFTIVLLPIMLLWHLDIPRIQKFGIAGIFAMGTFTCVAGLIRIKYVYVSFYETWDATWDLYDLFIWTEIEVLMASICGSAPALKVFFRNSSILPTTITTQNKTSGNSSVVTSLRHRHYRFPKLLRTGTATPTTTSAPSSNATINGDTEDIVTILDEKYSDVGKNDSVANKELCSNDSIDAVSTIGSMRQPSPPSFQKPVGPSAALERKTSKLSFDSIACYGRNNDGEGVEKMRSVRSFEAPREGRVGIKRNQSFEIGGARSRASLLGEVRIERMVEVVLEDRDGDEGNLGVRGGELNFG